MKNKFLARPLLRGVSDSITRGDLVLYTNITGKYFYLGPLNTLNSPNYSPDHTYQDSKNTDDENGYSTAYPKYPYPKLSKTPYDSMATMQFDTLKKPEESYLEPGSELDLLTKYTDLTLEGRHGNSIRIGSRRERPSINISNGRVSDSFESYSDGSNISLFSVGSLSQNLGGYYNAEGLRLSCDNDENNPRKLFINHGNNEDGNENIFDYDYGNPILDNYLDTESDQIIMFSNRITFDAKTNDLTLSAYRNINLGAGKNFTLTNRGFSVIESNNIYIGKEAKNKAQPMVLGDELRTLLLDIMNILQDSRALVQGVPIPLVKPDSAPMFDRIQNIINKLQPRTYEKDENGEDIETKPKIDGSPILSHYHYIEQNHRS